MRRWGVITALCLAALPGVAICAPAPGVSWSAVEGTIVGAPLDAAAAGSRVLVAGTDRRGRVIVTTLIGGRTTDLRIAGTLRGRARLRVLALPRGAALVVWGDADGYRPPQARRFGPERVVSRHPGAATGAARAPAVAVGPSGRVLVAWWGGPAGGRLGIQTAELGPGGRWSAPVDISAGWYPQSQVLLWGSGPRVALAAAASTDGGFGVVWLQPEGSRNPRGLDVAVLSARRTPAGAWQTPVVLGRGDISSFDLTAAATSAGEVIGAWAESRAYRPDGVTSTTCIVAAIAAPDGAASARDLACRAQYSPGRLRLAQTSTGATLAAWQAVPDFDIDTPLRAGIEVFARAPGARDWSAGRLAVADARGYHDLDGLVALRDGRALLVGRLTQALRRRENGRVRAVILDSDGSILQRIGGPPAPGGAPGGDQRLFTLTAGAIGVWPVSSSRADVHRASLLTVAPRPLEATPPPR